MMSSLKLLTSATPHWTSITSFDILLTEKKSVPVVVKCYANTNHTVEYALPEHGGALHDGARGVECGAHARGQVHQLGVPGAQPALRRPALRARHERRQRHAGVRGAHLMYHLEHTAIQQEDGTEANINLSFSQ